MGKIHAVSAIISRFFSGPRGSLASARRIAWAWAFNLLLGMSTVPAAVTIGDPLLGGAVAVLLLFNVMMFRAAACRYAAAKVDADFARESELIFARLRLDFNRE